MLSLFSKDSEQPSSSYYKAVKAYQLNPSQHFAEVKRQYGIDVAEIYARNYFQNQKPYQRFRREVELHPGEYNQLNKNFDVVVVPPPASFFATYQTHEITRQAMSLAMGARFREVLQVSPEVSSVLEGARRIKRVLQQRLRMGRNFIIVSFSFGSAYVRICLEHMDKDEVRGIKGWLNISGLIYGTPRFNCSDKFSFFHPMNRERRSFSCEQKYFRTALDNRGVKVIHWLGLKPASVRRERKQRDFLRAWGPNDGLLPWADYQRVTGPVVPLMNQGHLVNMSELGSFYLRSLSSMVSTLPQQQRMSTSSKLNFSETQYP